MEKDWKLFRKKLGRWQEAYMDKLVEEYKSILIQMHYLLINTGLYERKFMRIIKVLVFWQEMFLVQICLSFC